MRLLRLRWWFENRETGNITIAQTPNPSLIAAGIAWVIARIADEGTAVHDGAGFAAMAFLLVWGADELVRGVNPWRRVLGAGVILWQLGRFVL